MTKEEIEQYRFNHKDSDSESFFWNDERVNEYADQQTKELTAEVSKLENTLRVQGNVILKLTDAERIIEKQRKEIKNLEGAYRNQ